MLYFSVAFDGDLALTEEDLVSLKISSNFTKEGDKKTQRLFELQVEDPRALTSFDKKYAKLEKYIKLGHKEDQKKLSKKQKKLKEKKKRKHKKRRCPKG